MTILKSGSYVLVTYTKFLLALTASASVAYFTGQGDYELKGSRFEPE